MTSVAGQFDAMLTADADFGSSDLLLDWVNNGLSRPTAVTSAFGCKADEIGTITDIGQRMSAVGGRADVACQGLSGPFIAKSGNSVDRYLSHSILRAKISNLRASLCVKFPNREEVTCDTSTVA